MPGNYSRHNIVGSEADQPRPIAYMRSGRHKGALSGRGVAAVLLLCLVGALALTAAALPM